MAVKAAAGSVSWIVDNTQSIGGVKVEVQDARVSIGCRINRVCWFKGAVREVRFTRSALAAEQLLRP